MFEKLGPEARDIVVLSQEIAQSMGHGEVRGEHLLLALFERMDKELASEFADIGITYEQLLSAVQADFPTKEIDYSRDSVELNPEAQLVIVRSAMEAKRLGSKTVLLKHIFIAFEWYGVAERGNFYAWELLKKSGPEHKIRTLFGNIEFRSIKSRNERQPVARRITNANDSSVELKKSNEFSSKEIASDTPFDPIKNWVYAENFKDKHEIFDAAQDAALKHGHNKVGTQYLLFALARTPDSVASEILEEIGLHPLELDRIILEKYGRGPLVAKFNTVFTQGFVRVYEHALEIAKECNSEFVESEHVLRAIVRTGKQSDGCKAWELICERGIQDKLEELLFDFSHLTKAYKFSESQAVVEFRKKTQKDECQTQTSTATLPDFFSDQTLALFRQAKDEAQLLNHKTIGAEHVLLALFSTCTPEFLEKLANLKLNLTDTRKAVESILEKCEERIEENIPLGQDTKKLLEIAFAETRQLGKTKVEPIHILVAIAKMPEEYTITKVLTNLGVQYDWVNHIIQAMRSQVPSEINHERKFVSEKTQPTIPENFSETSIRVVENAHKEAWRFGYPKIQPEHLLLGLIKETSNEVSTMFLSRSITIKKLEDELNKLKDRGPGGSSILYVSDMVKEIFKLASTESEDLVEPTDLLGYLILSMDLTTINILRNLGLEDLLEGAGEYAPPAALFEYLDKNELNNYFVSDSLKIIFRAQEITRQFGHEIADVEHLLIALLELHEDKVVKLLLNNRLRVDDLKKDVRKTRGMGSIYPTAEVKMTPSALDTLKEATRRMETLKHSTISPGHMALGILQCKSPNLCKILEKYDLPADIDDQIVIALGGKSEK